VSFGLFERLRGRGLVAIAHRALREFYAPETRLGHALSPITAPAWRLFRDARRALTRQAPAKRRVSADTLTLYYDLDVAPITYDFLFFLAFAEAERRKRGLTRLEVVFVPGRKDGLRAELHAYELAVDPGQRRWRIHNMLVPLLALAPGCSGHTLAATREEAATLFAARGGAVLPDNYDPAFPVPPHGRDVMRRAGDGLELKVLAPPLQALLYARQWIDAHAGGRKVIAITVREYDFMPERNSNFAAWSAFAGELDQREYCVVIVPDTGAAMRPPRPELAGFLHFSAASWNVALRSAFAELAWLNLGSSGGPMTVCWFNANVRYVMFKILVEGVPQASAAFVAERGYRIGAPPPFVGQFQKWVWELDDLAVIRREFRAMAAALESHDPI
jgi:hypothetical protein